MSTDNRQKPAEPETISVTVTTYDKWYRLDKRIPKFIRGLRFDAPFRKRWMYNMWVYFAFFAQGFLGLITLSIFTRNLTAKPSGYLAAQRSRCQAVLKDEEGRAEAKAKDEEYVATTKVFSDEEDEMDDFMDRFSKKKVYDSKGHLVTED